MTTLLVVSPHLDDAVMSCAGAIYAHARDGHRVVVATVFTQGRDHARRRDEDVAACAALGAEALHLGLLDAPERLGIARSHRAIVEEEVVADADVSAVCAALDDVVDSVHAACIYAPLGVGDHIDHRVVHAAMHRRAPVVLYEDRPYAFLAGATRTRLAALGLRVRTDPGASSSGASDLDDAPHPAIVREQLLRLPHLHSYLTDDDGGARARAWLVSKLCGNTRSDLLSEVVVELTTHDAQTAAAAVRAIAIYESQLEDLFGTREGIATALHGPSQSAPLVERTFWRPKRPL
jgi:LmbE family N-acetylglucosaminyl deacetylase